MINTITLITDTKDLNIRAQHYGKPAYGTAEQIANATAPQAPQAFIIAAMAVYFIGAFQITRAITTHTGFILSVLIWGIAIWLTLGFRSEIKDYFKQLGSRVNPKRARYEQRVNKVYDQLYQAAHGKTLYKDQFSSNHPKDTPSVRVGRNWGV